MEFISAETVLNVGKATPHHPYWDVSNIVALDSQSALKGMLFVIDGMVVDFKRMIDIIAEKVSDTLSMGSSIDKTVSSLSKLVHSGVLTALIASNFSTLDMFLFKRILEIVTDIYEIESSNSKLSMSKSRS